MSKDNPVPSIYKDIMHVCAWYQGRDVDTCERVEAFAESLKNGVETNKVQPILKENCKSYDSFKGCFEVAMGGTYLCR